ncbi:glycosyltransferase family 2 protein [Micromonospora sp. H33]|uniref:glycosyltransferase family 2 protein n=1 Tax=Micromonospora sp. H33 TaxID=3452215 RepID=UPI003F8AAB92
MTEDVTVVVATRNRRGQVLETLCRHEAPVIMVDNGSDDGTPEAVSRAFPGVRVVRLGWNAGAGAARNVGVDLARTPFVAFADDDSYWAPGALAEAVRVLRAYPRTGLLAGRVLVGRERRLDPVSAEMARSPLGTPAGAPGPSVLGFLACAAVLRRDAFHQVGGFTERLRTYGEEALLAMDLAAAGWQLTYVADVVAHHLPLPAGRDLRERHRVEARNRVLTAALRRPAPLVLRTVAETLREPAGRRGLRDAGRELAWALRHRRRLPEQVEAALRTLERAPTGTPAPERQVPARVGN